MVVEFLTFEVDPAERERWLVEEEKHWSRFLETCDGFLGKEIWFEPDDPRRVHAVIRWDSMQSWQAVPRDQIAAVDAAMGPWRRDATMRAFEVIRDC